jgi:hypothetical protein
MSRFKTKSTHNTQSNKMHYIVHRYIIQYYNTPYCLFSFPMARQPLGGLDRLIIDASLSHFRHTTVGRTPLDEWSARRRDVYMTTHNTHNRQINLNSFRINFLLHRRHCTFITKNGCLILFSETVAVYSEGHTNPKSTLWGKMQSFFC